MREIDNNINMNVKGIQKPVSEAVPADKTAINQEQQPVKEIKDLSQMPAAELGRSQVTSSIESDINFLTKHPETVEAINKVIDDYSKNHSEEETLKFIDTALKEFSAK